MTDLEKRDEGHCPICGREVVSHSMVGNDVDFGGYRLKPCRHVMRSALWRGAPPGGRRPPPVWTPRDEPAAVPSVQLGLF